MQRGMCLDVKIIISNQKFKAMPKFIIIAERYVEEAWTLHVEADTEEEALQKVEDCPWDECEGVEHQQDVTSYRDEVEYRLDGIKEDES
jgi:hypothetical protein